MGRIRKSILIGIYLLIVACTSIASAQKSSKLLNKIDAALETGAFKRALRLSNKGLQKFSSSPLLGSSYAIRKSITLSYLTKYELADSSYKLFLQLKSSFPDTALRYKSQLYMDEAQYFRSKDAWYESGLRLDSARRLSSALDSSKALALMLRKAEALIQMGWVNESLKLLDTLRDPLRYAQSQTIKRSPNYIKLPKKTKKEARTQWATWLAFYDQALLQRGEYQTLDSSLSSHYQWIRKYSTSSSDAARLSLTIQARLFELRKQKSKATSYYLKAFRRSNDRFSEPHMLQLLENVVYSYTLENDNHRARKYIRKLESALRLEYGRRSEQYLRYPYVEVHVAYLQSKFNKSQKKLNKIWKSKTKISPNTPLYTTLLRKQYQLYLKNSNYEAAKDSLLRLLEMKSKMYGRFSPAFHKDRLLYAQYLVAYGANFKEATAIQQQSFHTIVKPQLSPQNLEYTRYLEQLAQLYDLLDNYDKSLLYLDTAASTVEKYYGKERVEYAEAIQQKAEQYLKKGDFVQAENYINEAVSLMKSLSSKENASNSASTYATLAKLYSTLGKYEEAQAALRKARKSSKKAKSTGAEVSNKSTDELADFYIKNGQYNDAESLLEKTIYLKSKRYGSESKELIVSYNQLTQLYLLQGNYPGAEKALKKSSELTLKVFGEGSLKMAENLKWREELLKKIGENIKAEEVANTVVDIQSKQLGSNHIDLAASLSDLALLVLHHSKESDKPLPLLRQSVKIVESNLGKSNPAFATQLANLAVYYIEHKAYDKADSLLREANAIWIKLLGPVNVQSADIAYLEGTILYRKGNYIGAQLRFAESRRIYKKLFNPTHPGYVRASSRMAHAYFNDKEYTKALKIMDEILPVYLKYTRDYFPSLSFNEKAKYWNMIKDDFEFYGSLCVLWGNKKPELIAKMMNYTIATKALLLSSSIKVKERILNSKDEQLIDRYNQWIAKKEQMTTLVSLSNESLKQMGISLQVLEKEINSLEKELSESSELFATNSDKKSITWKDIKKNLGPGEVALEMTRIRKFHNQFTDTVLYLTFKVSKETSKYPEMVVISNGKELEGKYLKSYRNGTKQQIEETYSYENFWQPIKSGIADGHTVYLAADGVYNQVNIEAMRNEEGKYALDQNDFRLISNTKDLVIQKQKEAVDLKNKAILCGNPTFYASGLAAEASSSESRGLTPTKNDLKVVKRSEELSRNQNRDLRSGESIAQLPGTELEVANLEKLLTKQTWSTRTYMGAQADEDSIKSIRSPKVFHIATHGFFKEDIAREDQDGLSKSEQEFTQNPLLRSGLLLKGAGDVLKSTSILDINSEKGVLTAYEAMNMNLDNTELVVLSACETGLGEVQVGEGVFGLQRAFLVAGSNSLIMSLFKVNDEVTQKLMNTFYELWISSGDKRKSFANAKKVIRQQYPQPIYWGSFVMTGF